MSKGSVRSSSVTMPDAIRRQRELMQLLSPLVEFFLRAGFTELEITKTIVAAIDRARKSRRPFSIKRVGDVELFSAVVRHWGNQREFLNSNGRPAPLPLLGKVSFRALARRSGYTGPIPELLRLMTKYGATRTTRSGRVELVTRHMNYTLHDVMTYEWNHRFMADAIAAATRGMGGVGGSKRLYSFVNVGNGISSRYVGKFLEDIKRRNLAYADELSPWLEFASKASRTTSSRGAKYRLGVGVFPICTRDR